jgi:hypothetical protein
MAQGLDDTLGRDVPGVAGHDMELLAVIVGAGVRVGVVVDGFERTFGNLECCFLILVILLDSLLLALPLLGRCAIMA